MNEKEIEKIKLNINNVIKELTHINLDMKAIDINNAKCTVSEFAKKVITENNITLYYSGFVFDDDNELTYDVDYTVETLNSNNYNDFIHYLELYLKSLNSILKLQKYFYEEELEKKKEIREKEIKQKELEKTLSLISKEVFRTRVNEKYYDYIDIRDIYPVDLKIRIEFENRNPHKYDAYDDFDVVIYIENDIVDYLINIEIVETCSAFGKVVTIVPKECSNEKYNEIKAKAIHVGRIAGSNFYHDGWWEAFPEE